jgi:LacI family transcriptional regulator
MARDNWIKPLVTLRFKRNIYVIRLTLASIIGTIKTSVEPLPTIIMDSRKEPDQLSKNTLTLKDIARKAGVSRSTVSRVINNHPNVSNEARQRVNEIIKSTGFHPNVAARSLAMRQTHMVGLVLPRSVSSFYSDPYFPRLTQGIAKACNQHHFTLGLFLVSTKADEEKIFTSVLRRGLLDGILLQSGEYGDPLIDDLCQADIPLVLAGRPFNSEGISYIDIDNVNAAYQAVTHLVKLGYQRIGTICGSANNTVSIDRKAGYINALTEAGHPITEELIAKADFSEVSGYHAMQRLLPAEPDAVFAASDAMALGAIRAVQENGLKVPQDIAFVGFDDLPMASLVNVQLTTVRQPVADFGFAAFELLLDLIKNGTEPPRKVILETELVIRESCGSN